MTVSYSVQKKERKKNANFRRSGTLRATSLKQGVRTGT